MANNMQLERVQLRCRKVKMLEVPQAASIVIIDDNASNLEFVAEALARSGLLILTSTQPEAGLALVAAHKPLIVLTDLIMPGINGYQLLRMVKQINPAIDVVLMSASDPQSDTNAMELAAGFLRKPIPMTELRECVARLLEKQQRPVPMTDC
jgi:DNA-binding NtrC family response regulator